MLQKQEVVAQAALDEIIAELNKNNEEMLKLQDKAKALAGAAEGIKLLFQRLKEAAEKKEVTLEVVPDLPEKQKKKK